MSHFSELNIDRQFPPNGELVTMSIKKSRRIKLIEGQTEMDLSKIDEIITQGVPSMRKNTTEQTINSDLPVSKDYLNSGRVEYLDSTNIPYIRKNILEIGRRGVLGDAESICALSDKDFVNRLVVIPRGTMHVEYYPKKHYYSHKCVYLTGSILALPITENDDKGPEQRYIYVGNFSSNEKIRKKTSIGSKIKYIKRGDETEMDPFKMPWGTLQIGQNLPAYKGNAIRVQILPVG